MNIYFAPLHGFTDYIFRNTHNKIYGNIDTYYTPFIRTGTGVNIKKKIKDILLENNKNIKIIPQILSNNSKHFISLTESLFDMGFNEVNLNMGCPFPMVTKKGSGAGMLKDLNKTNDFLKEVIKNIPNRLSIKIRTGFESNEKVNGIICLLNDFDLKNVIIHPRYAKQMYKGKVDLNIFEYVCKNLNHNIIYNGDILDLKSFQEINKQFPNINNFMLGRGLLINPALHLSIKNIEFDFYKLFFKFHDELIKNYYQTITHKHYVLDRMKAFWNYWNLYFNDKNTYKKIKKCKDITAYENIISEFKMI